MELSYSKQADWPKLPAGFSFRMVNNIAEDSTGRIYFVHRGSRPLVRFDGAGNFLGSLGDDVFQQSVNYNLTVNPPTPISRQYWLHGLHIDSWDNIWITDLGRHVVMKLSPEGKLLLTLGCLDQSGEDNDRFNQPTAVAVGRSGNIYVTDGYGNSRVVKFSPDGKRILSWGGPGSAPGDFLTPHGIALDEDENVYVAERMNDRVQVFDPAGNLLSVWPNLCRVDAIIVSREGEIFVGTGHGPAGQGRNTVHRFDRTGRKLGVVGSGENAFGYPHGLHLDAEGSLYVADPVAGEAAASPAKFVRRATG